MQSDKIICVALSTKKANPNAKRPSEKEDGVKTLTDSDPKESEGDEGVAYIKKFGDKAVTAEYSEIKDGKIIIHESTVQEASKLINGNMTHFKDDPSSKLIGNDTYADLSDPSSVRVAIVLWKGKALDMTKRNENPFNQDTKCVSEMFTFIFPCPKGSKPGITADVVESDSGYAEAGTFKYMDRGVSIADLEKEAYGKSSGNFEFDNGITHVRSQFFLESMALVHRAETPEAISDDIDALRSVGWIRESGKLDQMIISLKI